MRLPYMFFLRITDGGFINNNIGVCKLKSKAKIPVYTIYKDD